MLRGRANMKVMAVLGSPRRQGNSSTLAARFLGQAAKKGAETVSYFLEEMKYKGCKACGACKKVSDRCVIQDDLAGVLEEMKSADIIIFAVPNYFGDFSGQFKLFLDRTYSLLNPEFLNNGSKSRLPAGKHLVLIFTQGAPESAFKAVPEKYRMLKDYFQFASYDVIRGCNLAGPEETESYPGLLRQVDNLAASLLQGSY